MRGRAETVTHRLATRILSKSGLRELEVVAELGEEGDETVEACRQARWGRGANAVAQEGGSAWDAQGAAQRYGELDALGDEPWWSAVADDESFGCAAESRAGTTQRAPAVRWRAAVDALRCC